MNINGTLINYYFHCKRQCYLHGNRLNLEDNSEDVKIGKAIHEEKASNNENSELSIDNVKIDKLTIEIKKSDADIEASKWQLIYYLMVLKKKGIERKGNKMQNYISEINELLNKDIIPDVIDKPKCKKCAYFEYCYV